MTHGVARHCVAWREERLYSPWQHAPVLVADVERSEVRKEADRKEDYHQVVVLVSCKARARRRVRVRAQKVCGVFLPGLMMRLLFSDDVDRKVLL